MRESDVLFRVTGDDDENIVSRDTKNVINAQSAYYFLVVILDCSAFQFVDFDAYYLFMFSYIYYV